MSEVLVVGAGPVGLTMAAELARHGIRCRIIDALAKPLPYCRAIGVTPRTLEIWEDMGIARQMIDRGIWLRGMRIVMKGLPHHDMLAEPLDLPYGELGLPQYDTEEILTRHLNQFGIAVERGISLRAIARNDQEVRVTLAHADGTQEEATFQYLVGCDGAHSAVRRQLGMTFEGDAFPYVFMLGDVHIDWDLPRGIAMRAIQFVEDDAPKMFIAIPLPERGRYRVSMRAPEELTTQGGTDHGIQSELPSPGLEHLQAVADDLVPDSPRLTDLRWSSIFRISMRLASHYQMGRCFIAGDAAHIHPPTGGQGMNTGIQDAYNLAWKMALVLKNAAPPELLDSYEAERRPVGFEVVQRTRAATEAMANKQAPAPENPLVNTQTLISYRDSAWIRDDGDKTASLQAGDRVPDCGNLHRDNINFPWRLFEIVKGTEHVLLVHSPADDLGDEPLRLEQFTNKLQSSVGNCLRVVMIVGPDTKAVEPAGLSVYRDVNAEFANAFTTHPATYLIRPDGHIAWRGKSWSDTGLKEYLGKVFTGIDGCTIEG